jgi:hypothetical protein
LQTQVTAAANSLNAVEGGVAIVSNNNAHAAIASGQYVYIKNNATLAEGMYVATQSIGANGELTLSNVTPVSGGAINALQSATNQALSNLEPTSGTRSTGNFKTWLLGLSAGKNVKTFAGNAANVPMSQSGTCYATVLDGMNIIPFTYVGASGMAYGYGDKSAQTVTVEQVALKSDIVTENITGIQPDDAISAGTPGTRGAQKIVSYNCPAGYTVSSVIVTYSNNSNLVHPFVFLSNSNLYVNWYRATANAIDVGSAGISLRLTYVKS